MLLQHCLYSVLPVVPGFTAMPYSGTPGNASHAYIGIAVLHLTIYICFCGGMVFFFFSVSSDLQVLLHY